MALHRRNFSVAATDKRILMDVLKKNILDYLEKVDKPGAHIDVLEFEWEKVVQSEPEIPLSMRDADLIVCSDCLYDSTSVEPLLQTLEMVGGIHLKISF